MQLLLEAGIYIDPLYFGDYDPMVRAPLLFNTCRDPCHSRDYVTPCLQSSSSCSCRPWAA